MDFSYDKIADLRFCSIPGPCILDDPFGTFFYDIHIADTRL